MKLRGRTALVTGGAVRLGKAICEELARHGCDVVIHYNASSEEAMELAAALKKTGSRAFALKCDLSERASCGRLIDRALKAAGRLDILINNAAIFQKRGLVSASEEELLQELSVNLLAPIWLTRAFARRVNRGKIVNLLDRRIAANEAGMISYLLSKKALADFTRLAALELAPRFHVNAVAPGPVLPPAGRSAVREPKGRLPLRKMPSILDVAGAVLFLLERDSITGEIIRVDGGQHLLGSRA